MDKAATSFDIRKLDYDLPRDLIAQFPIERRDDARMLIVHRNEGTFRDAMIRDFGARLRPGDLLVLNDTRVIPARFTSHRKTGGRIDGLFLREIERGVWLVLLEGAGRLKAGESLALGQAGSTLHVQLLERGDEGQWVVRIKSEEPAHALLDQVGQTPLPPYILRKTERRGDPIDRERYQTVYARRPGAVAAPTAGLHFTREMLDSIRLQGVEVAFVTLHVGPGTFKPISTEDLSDHVMHEEEYEIPSETVEAWRRCKSRSGRVVAVGTTALRVLETVFASGPPGPGHLRGRTRLFIYPPCEVRSADILLTNFHLPRSTLLALVMAFAGVDLVRRAYAHAVAAGYRFYSYGDAMFIE